MSNLAKLLLTVMALATAAKAAATDIAGIWSSTSRTKGGLGAQWTFAGDGRATYTFGAIVDFLYSTTETQIAMSFVQQDGTTVGEKSANEFSLPGDTLTINPTDAGRRQVMRRVGASRERTSVTGEWAYKHYTGGPALMRYSSDGRGQLVVPMKKIKGSYRADN